MNSDYREMPSYIGHWFKDYPTSFRLYLDLMWCFLSVDSTTLLLMGHFTIKASWLPLGDVTNSRLVNDVGIKLIVYFHVKWGSPPLKNGVWCHVRDESFHQSKMELIEELRTRKTNLHLEYVSISVRMACCSPQDWKFPMQSTCH